MDVKSAHRHVDRQIAAIAKRQYGLVTREQLLRIGLGRGAIERRLAIRRLHLVHRGVYTVGPTLSGKGRYLAAVLACGKGAVASHRTAGSVLGIRPTASATIHVTVPTRNGRPHRSGIVIHRTAVLIPADVTTHDRIPVTSLPRTLIDLGALLQPHELRRALERAEILRIFDLRAVQATMEAHPGRPGTAALKTILESAYGELGVTRTDLEALFLEICAQHGIPRPLVNTYVGPYEVDFFWPAHRVIVETDGRETHGTRASFERDRARDARLQAAGYRVLRFTYRQVLREPKLVAELLRSVLGLARAPS